MKHYLFFLFAGFICTSLFTSCEQIERNKSHQKISVASMRTGKKLAAQYCASCHILPDPSLADAESWEKGILPQMGPRLGMSFYGGTQYPASKMDFGVDKNYYPSSPVLSAADWQHIIDYYTAASPDTMPPANRPVPVKMNNNLFQPLSPSFSYYMPMTSYVKINNGSFTMCDASGGIYMFNKKLQLQDSLRIKGAVTDMIADSTGFIICNTGLLRPNNGKYGSLQYVDVHNEQPGAVLFKDLRRPVQITRADINNDGKQDFVVNEFGNLEGALSWLEKADTGYVRHVIRAAPGAIRSYIDDVNKDGLPDIWALFAQGDESIYLFINKGKGVFEPKRILRFPPSYGSSYFEMDDMNNDGFKDIIYTCGDNADFSTVLKPYHGVYIFINDGHDNFTQQYFYPLNGCYKAVAKDFDGDGDLDIATMSFFADYKRHPEEGFVYFQNNGNFNFQPYSTEAAKYGRWLTMDVGDFDADGKPDIALGNFSLMDPIFEADIDWKRQPPFIILKNMQ